MADEKPEGEKTGAGDEAKGRKGPGLSLKVSQKGALSVYGLGRFPVTLYKEQWLKLLDMSSEIRAFLQQNETALKAKGAEDKAPRAEAGEAES
jgi:hypothetical protein